MRGMTGLAIAGAAALMAGAADAQQWIQAPSVADVAAAYPAKAKAAGVGGAVNLTCTVNYDGRPHDCYALGEKPSGMGFAVAAKKLAEKLQVQGLNGQEVRVPVTFDPQVLKGGDVTVHA